ncbi:MAG: hypothetical protein ACR2FU_20010 [Streptosporangiaceae bacterium]
MRFADGAVIHQVHPAKIGADVAASVLSDVLAWHGRPRAALAVRVVVPVAASVAVLAAADLDGLSRTRRGRYVLVHMPLAAQGVRLAGDAMMGVGAGRRRVGLMAAGAVLIGAGWAHPLWPGQPGSGRHAASARAWRRWRRAQPRR